MAALICGSFAFDTIASFEGRFADQIMPDQLHILNVSFYVPMMRRDFGGCAGNIAYSLHLLGGHPLPVASVGEDGEPYLQRLQALGINTRYMAQVKGELTAQAMIMTDRDNNQITSFHPGAMMHSGSIPLNLDADIKIAIIAPDNPQAMLQRTQQLADAQIPFVFDPGQNLPLFNGDQLRHFIQQATWLTVNDYEGKMLCERTGWSLAEISHQVRALVVTLGEQGCEIWAHGEREHIPATPAPAVLDPTGCGDAWRGALLYGLERGWSVAQCARLGGAVAASKIAQRGPQNYTLDFDPARFAST